MSMLNKISYLKTAGVSELVLLRIRGGKAVIEGYKADKNPFKLSSSKPVLIREKLFEKKIKFDGDFTTLLNELVRFAEESGLKDYSVVADPGVFRVKEIKTPFETTADEELWFLENTQKFLPKSGDKDNFYYRYFKYHSDNDYASYIVAITRKESIDNFTRAAEKKKLNILSITPFQLSPLLQPAEPDKPRVYIEETEGSIQFFYNFEGGIIHDEFLNETGENSVDHYIARRISDLLGKKKDLNQGVEPLLYYSGKENGKNIADRIQNMFRLDSTPELFPSGKSVIDMLFYDFGRHINFLEGPLLSSGKEKREKNILNRTIIAIGLTLAFFLSMNMFLAGFLTSRIDSDEESLIEIESGRTLAEKLNKENDILKKNLLSLADLQNKHTRISHALKELSYVFEYGASLSSVETEGDENKVSFTLSGYVTDNEQAVHVVNKLERISGFNNVKLIHSGKVASNKKHPADYQFTIRLDYYGND